MFYVVVGCAAVGVPFALGLRAGAEKTSAYFFWTDVAASLTDSVALATEEAPTITGIRPSHFLQPSRYDGEGVTINAGGGDPDDLILLTGFFDDGNELRMIRRDGRIVARWPVKYHELFPNANDFVVTGAPTTDWNIEIHGAMALPDGSVVFNFGYAGMARLDRCNNVEWTLRRQTHHAVSGAERGGFWVPGRRMADEPSPYPPFETPFREDTVMHVSEQGEVLSEFSIGDLLYHHGLRAILTATGNDFAASMNWGRELVHLNQVEELASDLAPAFPMFEAGDLLLSLRNRNLLLVTDPSGTTVKWWQIGPWLRQHDPHFMPDGRILMFNNNSFRTVFLPGDEVTPPTTPLVSQILAVDPATGQTEVLWGGAPGEEMLSVIRGKVSRTPTDTLLITEPDGGRAREVSRSRGVLWEYVNRYSEDEIAQITEAELYPASNFTFDTHAWTCD